MPITQCTELKKQEPDFILDDLGNGYVDITYVNEFTNGIKVADRMTLLKSRYEAASDLYKILLKKIFDKNIENHFKYPSVY